MSVLKALATLLLAHATIASGQNVAETSVSSLASSSLEVDVGYAVYQGYQEAPFNVWLGIRFAAPPLGDNRWRAPQNPAQNTSSVIQANAYGPQCPQAPQSPLPLDFAYQGDEDCLYLNVWAPKGAKNLPVMFYIHGGGYGSGNGQLNASQLPLVSAANYGFVSVAIQYRLEAFGFLASPDVKANGSLNAGLLDQHFALEWTQKHIHKFGGDPTRVTLAGQSAGAGSVMLQVMAYGGEDGNRYFEQGIASSPYLPAQNNYSDSVPINRYNRFAKASGCGDKGSGTLDCLRQADTNILQKANAEVGSGVIYGSWGFVPVTDGNFVRERPSQQLPTGKINGQRILTSNNADEGAQFVNPNLTTNADFERWLRNEYPYLTTEDIYEINNVYYPSRAVGNVPYASCGDCGGATAVNVGSFAVGPEQRAINLYSELTFVCPSYWLAEGFTKKAAEGYKYQFSVVPSFHGLDLSPDGLGACPSIFSAQVGPDMCTALTQAWANFITTGSPSIPNTLANGNASANPHKQNSASHWPLFKSSGPNAWQMLNLNQTGGTLYTTTAPLITGLSNVTEYVEPGLMNNITKVNAYTWEGGRGARCDFWRRVNYPS